MILNGFLRASIQALAPAALVFSKLSLSPEAFIEFSYLTSIVIGIGLLLRFSQNNLLPKICHDTGDDLFFLLKTLFYYFSIFSIFSIFLIFLIFKEYIKEVFTIAILIGISYLSINLISTYFISLKKSYIAILFEPTFFIFYLSLFLVIFSSMEIALSYFLFTQFMVIAVFFYYVLFNKQNKFNLNKFNIIKGLYRNKFIYINEVIDISISYISVIVIYNLISGEVAASFYFYLKIFSLSTFMLTAYNISSIPNVIKANSLLTKSFKNIHIFSFCLGVFYMTVVVIMGVVFLDDFNNIYAGILFITFSIVLYAGQSGAFLNLRNYSIYNFYINLMFLLVFYGSLFILKPDAILLFILFGSLTIFRSLLYKFYFHKFLN